MQTDSQKTPYNPPVLEFKSSTFSVPVLVLSGNDLEIVEQQLQAKIQLAPEFFKNSPLVIDLQELNKHNIEIDLERLVLLIRTLGLLPVGMRGGNVQQNILVMSLGIPVYSISSTASTGSNTQKTITPPPVAEAKKETAAPDTTATPSSAATLITQQVRSGQRIYATGDLVVVAQVSAGAEIMAEGNIHVYNVLRGRALAGVQGNSEARIFCSDLQAELVSIAGTYKISEDLDETVRGKPVQVYLQNDNLKIKDIL